MSCHRLVHRIACILRIHHTGHALQGFLNLLFAHDAVEQPVGNVLAADTQRRAVFHQPHVVYIRHFGTTHALVNPSHHIAQNTLGVVVQFLLFFFLAPVRRMGDRNG